MIQLILFQEFLPTSAFDDFKGEKDKKENHTCIVKKRRGSRIIHRIVNEDKMRNQIGNGEAIDCSKGSLADSLQILLGHRSLQQTMMHFLPHFVISLSDWLMNLFQSSHFQLLSSLAVTPLLMIKRLLEQEKLGQTGSCLWNLNEICCLQICYLYCLCYQIYQYNQSMATGIYDTLYGDSRSQQAEI